MPIDVHLKQKLEELDNQYGGDEMFRLFGPTSLTWAGLDSARAYMYTSHIKQALTLLNPDIPHLQTGFENSVGKYNHAYKKLDGSWEVKQIIPKFSSETIVENKASQIYTIVLYNKKTDTYDMLEKPIAENLTEKFGYVYNTDFMDSLEKGQKVSDTILYKSTAYDNNMNYRFGKNANVYYSTSTDTIEDAIVIRRGWAEEVKSVEIDSVMVPVNDNDVLLNLYGLNDGYKPFPDIGEFVRDSLICATRRINKRHLLYDFQQNNMKEVMDTDTDYYVSKNSIVYDINVYYNGDEELPENLFNEQIRKYYTDNCNYATAILQVANEIKDSGSNYTSNVSYYRSKYLHYNDSAYKWKNKDKTFGHIVIEFKVKSIVSLELGSKLTGRYGNKGVISRIADESLSLEDSVIDMIDDGSLSDDDKRILRSSIAIADDERMPYYEVNGTKVPVDVMLNASGAIRRLNPGQLVEVEVNFIAEQVRHKIIAAKSMHEKEQLLFKFLESVNKDQNTFFKNLYNAYDITKMINGINVRFLAKESKEAFIKDVEEHGFYIVRPPHKPLLFDDVIHLYEIFPDIKPVDIYVDLFGIKKRKMVRPGIVGYQYMIILKQNSNKNFSARSTFRVNRSNLPAKDIAKKTNRSSYARTPVRLSEIYNLLASISGTDLAEYNIFMRSSALGRKSLDRILTATTNPLKLTKLKVKDTFTNANADILAAKLKTLGLRIFMSSIPEGRMMVYDDAIYPLHYGDYTIYDYPSRRGMYQELFDAFNNEIGNFLFVETYRGEKHDICWDKVFSSEVGMKYDITEDIKSQLKAVTKCHVYIPLDNNKYRNNYNSTSSDPLNPGHKKRGRKSKAEKEAEMLRLQKLEREKYHEERDHDIKDSNNNEELDSDVDLEGEEDLLLDDIEESTENE